MKKSSEIKLNSKVLITLRETSGYIIEEVAKKLNINVGKVKAIEQGLASFTLAQIKKLARITIVHWQHFSLIRFL